MNDPNWAEQLTAWATLAYVVLTFILAIAAIATFRKVRDQLNEERRSNSDQLSAVREDAQAADRRHEEQLQEMTLARRSGNRPVVVLVGPRAVPTAIGHCLEISLRNVGMGPCMRARTELWVLADDQYDGSFLLTTRPAAIDQPPWGCLEWKVPTPVSQETKSYATAVNSDALLALPQATKSWLVWTRTEYWGVHGDDDRYMTPEPPDAVLLVASLP